MNFPVCKISHRVCVLILVLFSQFIVNAAVADSSKNGIQQALIQTTMGGITIELYADKAPITVANYIAYIKDSAFNGGEFYRVVGPDNDQGTPQISVIQGRASQTHTDFPPISLETTRRTKIKHLDGTLSMARGGPDSATQEFFICVGPQPALDFSGLRNPDGQGFAAFGRVIAGMDIVKAIQQNRQTKAVDEAYVENQILAQPVKILSISLIAN